MTNVQNVIEAYLNKMEEIDYVYYIVNHNASSHLGEKGLENYYIVTVNDMSQHKDIQVNIPLDVNLYRVKDIVEYTKNKIVEACERAYFDSLTKEEVEEELESYIL